MYKADSISDYFYKYISLCSSLMSEDYKLTYREIMFLTECCMYNYEGNDLTDVKSLSQYLIGKDFFKRETDTSLYKYKMGVKKWARTGRDEFTLPPALNKKPGDSFTAQFKLELEQL